MLSLTVAVLRAARRLPLTLLDATDDGTWAASDWAAEALPYLIYGWVTAIING